jgi:hypothetical protein
MAGIWQHRIVFSIHLGSNISDWFDLPCVDGIRKRYEGEPKPKYIVYLKNVVRGGLQRDGLSMATVDNCWLCHDEEGRWWLLEQAEYEALDEERHVTLFPNKQTQRQIFALKAASKLQREFDAMPPEEQEALYNQYPDLIIKTDDNN